MKNIRQLTNGDLPDLLDDIKLLDGLITAADLAKALICIATSAYPTTQLFIDIRSYISYHIELDSDSENRQITGQLFIQTLTNILQILDIDPYSIDAKIITSWAEALPLVNGVNALEVAAAKLKQDAGNQREPTTTTTTSSACTAAKSDAIEPIAEDTEYCSLFTAEIPRKGLGFVLVGFLEQLTNPEKNGWAYNTEKLGDVLNQLTTTIKEKSVSPFIKQALVNAFEKLHIDPRTLDTEKCCSACNITHCLAPYTNVIREAIEQYKNSCNTAVTTTTTSTTNATAAVRLGMFSINGDPDGFDQKNSSIFQL